MFLLGRYGDTVSCGRTLGELPYMSPWLMVIEELHGLCCVIVQIRRCLGEFHGP